MKQTIHLISLRFRVGLLILSFTVFHIVVVLSQEEMAIILIPITISDSSRTIVDTFGFYPSASYCIDTFLYTLYAETELPSGPAPPIFDVRFVEHRVGSNCLGNGAREILQDFISLDTFRLRVSKPNSTCYPRTLRWSSGQRGAAYLGGIWLSAISGAVLVPVMMSDSTYQLSSGISLDFDIIGEPTITSVDEPNKGVPTEYHFLKITQTHSIPQRILLFQSRSVDRSL